MALSVKILHHSSKLALALIRIKFLTWQVVNKQNLSYVLPSYQLLFEVNVLLLLSCTTLHDLSEAAQLKIIWNYYVSKQNIILFKESNFRYKYFSLLIPHWENVMSMWQSSNWIAWSILITIWVVGSVSQNIASL